MRLMLSTTHETLLQSLRDVHAAQLELRELRVLQLQEKLESERTVNQALELRLKLLADLVASQQQTIKTAMSDLVILKGAGRVRSEQETPPDRPELRPDIEITDAPTDLEDRRKLISDAEREYEEALARLAKEIDTSNVTPAAVAAAIPESEEAWRREHAQPSDDSILAFVPGD